jgi:endonuclease G, mitochondrial
MIVREHLLAVPLAHPEQLSRRWTPQNGHVGRAGSVSLAPWGRQDEGGAMGRMESLRHIDSDAVLKEEILTRIGEDSDIGESLIAAAPEGLAPSRPPRVSVDRARAVLEHPPELPVDPSLEAIILRMGRPVLLVRNDDVDLDALGTDTWRARLEPAQDNLRAAIRSVGRIELDRNPQFDWVGTGWVVADDVIVTNRHVAEIFAHRVGEQFRFRTSFLGQMEARLDFREEHEDESAAEFRIVDVLHIEDDAGPDMAFLRLDWASDAADVRRPPIQLATDLEPGSGVAVIGYPAKDTRTRIHEDMDRIFGDIYDVKRLAPGEVAELIDQGRFLTHDCTTLGGNSGSVVLDLESGAATALHFAGREEVRNYAVSAPVVRARLEQVLTSAAVPGVTITPQPPDPFAARAPLEGRQGYDRDFLAATVDHPSLSEVLADAVAPVAGNADGILNYTNFSIRMHRHRRLAMYTAVNIDGAKARNVRRGRDRWALDPRLQAGFQIGNELYARNKLDRGHLVRRLDPAWGDTLGEAETAVEDTFYYTNCSPQHEVLNQQLWLGLEDYILGNAHVHDLRVSVFSGPVFRDDDRRYREFLIPEDFWKVVAMVNDDNGQLSVTGYLLSQRDFMDDLEFTFGPYMTYQIPVARIEEQTGLDFGTLKQFDPIGELETFGVRPLSALADIRL